MQMETSGCTAVALLLTSDKRMFCANAGDSRCVLSSAGVAIPLSFDHKPFNESTFMLTSCPQIELLHSFCSILLHYFSLFLLTPKKKKKKKKKAENKRITEAGGFVHFGRVNGNLALSRAIGDMEFKRNSSLPPEKQIVTGFSFLYMLLSYPFLLSRSSS